jgi:hypothetical protein
MVSDSGFLYLRPHARRLALVDREGLLVDARFLNAGEVISLGSEISLPCHRVKICSQDQPVVRTMEEPALGPALDLRHYSAEADMEFVPLPSGLLAIS